MTIGNIINWITWLCVIYRPKTDFADVDKNKIWRHQWIFKEEVVKYVSNLSNWDAAFDCQVLIKLQNESFMHVQKLQKSVPLTQKVSVAILFFKKHFL